MKIVIVKNQITVDMAANYVEASYLKLLDSCCKIATLIKK